jgi:membrane associated rhomboid family serine protease
MRDAAVGFQCPDCLAAGSKAVRQPRTIGGGAIPRIDGAATRVLIGLNVVVYVLTGPLNLDRLTVYGAMIAERVVYDGTLVDGLVGGEYWRLVSSAFLHANLFHLLFNMFALFLFGAYAENLLGTTRFVAFYLVAAVFSSAAVYLLTDPYTPTVGASGAVFALFGFALITLLKAGQDVRSLVVLLAINAFLSLQAGISWQGHLGGFIAGVLVGGALALAPRGRGGQAMVASTVLLVVIAAAVVVVRTLTLT